MRIRVLLGLHADASPINAVADGVAVAQSKQRFHQNDLPKDA